MKEAFVFSTGCVIFLQKEEFSGGRAGPAKLNLQHSNDVRSSSAYQNPPERGKRKKGVEEDEVADDENLPRTRGESYRRGGVRGAHSVCHLFFCERPTLF